MEHREPDLDQQFTDFFDDDDEGYTPPVAAKAVDIQVSKPLKQENEGGGKFAFSLPQSKAVKVVNEAPVTPSVVESKSLATTRAAKRKLLNKHDYELLHFLAKADYCTTRQLALALNRRGEEDALRRKLKGLEASGYTAVYKRTGGKDIWMVTAKAIAKLKKQHVIERDSRLKPRDPASITGAKLGHTLAVAQVMAWMLKDSKRGLDFILSEREVKSYHFAMKAQADKKNPTLAASEPQEALYAEYRERLELAGREDLDPTTADQLDGFSFESEQSPEEVFPELFRPMTRNAKHDPYGQSPDFVIVKHRTRPGQAARSVAVEVELNPKSHGAYLEILAAYRDSPFIGKVAFYIPFEEERTYRRGGEVHSTVRLEDRLRAAASELGMTDCVLIDYLRDAQGQFFSGDVWGL